MSASPLIASLPTSSAVTSSTGRPTTASSAGRAAQRRRPEAEQADAAAGHAVVVVEFAPRPWRPRWRNRRGGGRIPRTAKPDRPPHTGNRTAVRISSGANDVSHRPVKNSAAGICLPPRDDVASIVRVERERHRGVLRGRVGVRDRAAQRAPGADLEVPDVGRRQRQQRHRLGHLVVHADQRVRRGRADPRRRRRAVRCSSVRRCGRCR